ncbi:MAG: OB-fold nucleic acid binding domain-containing protein [Propionibacteriaceae bacterium]|jgi:RecG-like helicase|nr:OB-fold nucleic acid binding domain-containing protein [Propionibacteriaceae bacterium]
MSIKDSLRQVLQRFGAPAPDPLSPAPESSVQEQPLVPIAKAQVRKLVRIMGRVTTLTVRPRKGTPWLEAELTDDTGTVNLIWIGRSEIQGVEVDCQLIAEGRLALMDGQKRIYNPKYELVPR